MVLLVILAVLPALALSLHTGLEERRAATERVRESTALFSRLASTHHARLIEGTRQFLATLAQMPEVRQAPRSGCDRLLATLLRQQPAYADFGVVDASGLPLCAGLPTASASRAGRVEIERAVEGRTFAVGEVEPSGIPVRPALRVALPIVDEANALRAVVWAALDLAWLSEFTSRAGLPPGGTLQLVDATGTVI
ncbi:MAG TPA: cache domain-containing protein, partial [Vicinamibacteria bacterium]|nr:cache domain-containing protein [Vicinamibacteria bacterium]